MSNPYPLNILDKTASVRTNHALENKFEICRIADRKKSEVQIALPLLLTPKVGIFIADKTEPVKLDTGDFGREIDQNAIRGFMSE